MKSLNLLGINITNNKNGKYEFKIRRKNAIANAPVKPVSGRDSVILNGILLAHRCLRNRNTVTNRIGAQLLLTAPLD